MKYSLRFFCTERIIFAKASALCCEDGDSLTAEIKVFLEVLSKMQRGSRMY